MRQHKQPASYEARKARFALHPKPLKRGFVHPETGMVFFTYAAGAKDFEVWLTKERFDARVKLCAEHNKGYVEARRKWKSQKYHGDLLYRLTVSLRGRIKAALRRKSMRGMEGTREALGCDAETAKAWLEAQFVSGMTWDNFGQVWHVDHIMPFSVAKTPEEVRQLGHYTNTRPLFVNDNLRRPKDGSDLISPWPRRLSSPDQHQTAEAR